MEDVKNALQLVSQRLQVRLVPFEELDNDKVKKHLHYLAAGRYFTGRLFNSPSESTSHTLYSIDVDFDRTSKETATRVVIRAAFKEWNRRDLSLEDFGKECAKIFRSDNEFYDVAFRAATDNTTVQDDGQTATEVGGNGTHSIEVWVEDLLDAEIEDNVREAGAPAETRDAELSTLQLRAIALSGLVKWSAVTEREQIEAIQMSNDIFCAD